MTGVGDWMQASENPVRCPDCGYVSRVVSATMRGGLVEVEYECISAARHLFYVLRRDDDRN